jgi:predicted pyridoxine 5'-phosphate oxidase superfamily flavin-nucleotide-binding protein
MPFHPGEVAVQEQAGVRRAANEVGESIVNFIPPPAGDFLAQRSMAVAASVAPTGAVWASVIAGPPGFMQVSDPHSLTVNVLPRGGDPMIENLAREAHVALIIPEFSTARRVRVNGIGWIAEGAIHVRVAQAYANCRRYIQKRRLLGMRTWAHGAQTQRSSIIAPEHREIISKADTFFIASDHPEAGADISHKGGNPGFVQVLSDRRITFPDYNGNSMFNTLGNLNVNPAAGLLFIDFDSGRTLQLTGRATINWSQQRASSVKGAERMVDFELEQLINHPQGFALHSELAGYSPFNPA